MQMTKGKVILFTLLFIVFGFATYLWYLLYFERRANAKEIAQIESFVDSFYEIMNGNNRIDEVNSLISENLAGLSIRHNSTIYYDNNEKFYLSPTISLEEFFEAYNSFTSTFGNPKSYEVVSANFLSTMYENMLLGNVFDVTVKTEYSNTKTREAFIISKGDMKLHYYEIGYNLESIK